MTNPQAQLVSRQMLALAKVRGIGGGLILALIKGLLPQLIQLIMELLSAQPQLAASDGTSKQSAATDVLDVIRTVR